MAVLADHYGVLLSPCRPYHPEEKGKESHIFKVNIAEAGTLQSMLEKISNKKAVIVL